MTGPADAADLALVLAELESRWPEHRIEPSLARITALMEILGDPQRAYPVIHVTGTNGKTSTARMIEALLRAHGLRTGLLTSPHLVDARERICLDGDPIDADRFLRTWQDMAPYVAIVDQNATAHEGVPMSFFEVTTAMAFVAFADAPVDVAVVEVGMGGTWDATNVADGTVAVVTPVDLDHADYLGDTIALIAAEKAGIIKDDAFAVLAHQTADAAGVLMERCALVGATPVREGVEFGVEQRDLAVGGQVLALRGLGEVIDQVFLPLHGDHQASNAAVALAAVEAFLGGGASRLDADIVREGFASVTSPGRMEIVRRSPTVIVDACHNPHGARALAAALQDSFDFASLVGVVGVLGDKDARGILLALEPALDAIVVTAPASPRAMPVEALTELAMEVFGEERTWVEEDLVGALDRAASLAEEQTTYGGAGVVVAGSVVLAGQAKRLLDRSTPAERSRRAVLERELALDDALDADATDDRDGDRDEADRDDDRDDA